MSYPLFLHKLKHKYQGIVNQPSTVTIVTVLFLLDSYVYLVKNFKVDTIDTQEKEWLADLKQGKEKGLKMIFDQYYTYLVSTASHYVTDKEKAKDIVQDVFFELWKKRETIVIQSSIRPYLRKATVNRSLNHIKSNKRYQWGEEHIDMQREDTSVSVEKKLEVDDLQTVINKAIESLPERCQLIFKLSRLENLSHKEISSQLDISTKTIENQMTKALKTIRKAVQQYGISPIIIIILQFLILA